VVELRGDLRLVQEHSDEGGIVRELWQDPLDDQRLLEAGRSRGAGSEHLCHPAAADPLHELVLADLHR
jgi:hypothetical protein